MGVRLIDRGKKAAPSLRDHTSRSALRTASISAWPRASRVHEGPLLSILIPTIPGREAKLSTLLGCLEPQAKGRGDVEIMVLRDLRSMTIGDKRNRMIAIARGEYVAFVDDDDAVASDYVEAIASVLRSEGPDVLCFTVTVRGHGSEKLCRYDPTMNNENLPGEYRRKPNHLMVWRRALAVQVPFQPVKFGEDTAWANAISKLAKSVATIDRPLYTYQFDPSDNSSTLEKPRP